MTVLYFMVFSPVLCSKWLCWFHLLSFSRLKLVCDQKKISSHGNLRCKVNGVSQKPPSVLWSIHQAKPKGFSQLCFQHNKQPPRLTPFHFTTLILLLIPSTFFHHCSLSFQSSSNIIFPSVPSNFEYSSRCSLGCLICLWRRGPFWLAVTAIITLKPETWSFWS